MIQKIRNIDPTVASSLTAVSEVRFLIENSASMDGYVQGVTEFKSTIQNLMVLIKHANFKPQTVSAGIVNERIFPIENFNPESFANLLQLYSKEWRQGNRADSDLNQLIKRALEGHKTQDLTFFVSDLIYGLNRQDPVTYLPILKNQVLDTFLTEIKSHKISVIVIKINSKYQGTYWDYKNGGRAYNGQRPLYILAMGRPQLLDILQEEIEIEKLSGFENFLRLDYSEKKDEAGKAPRYTFLCNSIIKGKCEVGTIQDKVVKSLSSSSPDVNGSFDIPICFDSKNITGISLDYLLDERNYESISPLKLEFSTKEELTLKGIDKKFYEKLKPDVCFRIIGNDLKRIPGTVQITLKDKLPSWIAESSIIDDTSAVKIEGKTFGFHYFMQGLYDAYHNANGDNQNIFSIKLELN